MTTLEELLRIRVARFVDRQPDWDAFADARGEGYRRAQHRCKVKVFFEDGAGRREETVLGRWDCVSAPAGVLHGFENVGLEPAYLQVMLGRARPDLMTYADPGLQAMRDAHLGAARA